MAVGILHFIHPLFEDNGFSRVMVSQKCLDSAKDQCLNHTFTSGTSESKTSNDKEAQLEDCKVGAGDWLAQNFDLSKDFNVANCQIHQTAEFMPRQPTKVTRTTLIMEPALIEPTNGTQKVSSITTQFWANESLQGHLQYYERTHSQDSGYHNWRWLPWIKSRDRWTQLTLLVKIMTHTTFAQINLSVSASMVNPLFPT